MTHTEKVCKIMGERPPNINLETGIHYGVISQHAVMPEALDDLFNGTNLSFDDYQASVFDRIKTAIKEALGEFSFREESIKRIAEAAVEEADNCIGDDYNSDNDIYEYTGEGYRIRNDSGGDLWVLKSPYYTLCGECSPCAPNAGYLTTQPGTLKTYALGPDWYPDHKLPYPCFKVDGDSEVVVSDLKVECPNCNGKGRDTLKRLVEVRQENPNDISAKITMGEIKVEDFDGETFKCWRCAGHGHTIEKRW